MIASPERRLGSGIESLSQERDRSEGRQQSLGRRKQMGNSEFPICFFIVLCREEGTL
jgi:hypothetical protein